MEFRVLGPLEVLDDGRIVPLGGGRQRALLALLLLHRNEAVAVDRLVDDLWGDHQPETAANVVQVYVSRLRKALQSGGNGEGILRTHGSAYVLRVEDGALDVDRFERLAEEGRAPPPQDPEHASAVLREALGRWRAAPLSDFTFDSFAQEEIGRLEERRLAALEDRIDADLARARPDLVIGDLETLAREHPFRERVHAQLMLALYRSGRQAEALELYRRTSRRFIDELGIEPGPALKALEQSILRHEVVHGLQSPGGADGQVDVLPKQAGRARPLRIGGRPALAIAVAVLLAIALALVYGRRGGQAGSELLAPNSVGFVDAKSGRVTRQYPVDGHPTSLVAAGNSLWVGNFSDETVTRINRATETIRAIPVGGHPSGVAYFQGKTWVWTSQGRLVPIDPQYGHAGDPISFGRRVERAIHLALAFPSASPSAGRIVSGGGFLWLTLPPTTVIRVNPAKPERAWANAPYDGVQGALAYRKGSAWIGGLDRVFPITATTPDVVRTDILVGRVHCMTFGAGSLWVISGGHWDQGIPIALRQVNVNGGQTDEMIPVGDDPVAIASGGGSIWVGSGTDRAIRRIDPVTNLQVATTPLGAPVMALAADPEGVWVAVGEPAIGRTSR